MNLAIKNQETLPVYDAFKKMVNAHPEKDFKKSKNLNFLGEIIYFIGMQLFGIMPIAMFLLLGSIIIITKVIQIGLILILSIFMTIALFLFKIYKTITYKKINHKIIYENI